MKRSIKSLTNWKSYEKKLLRDKKFVKSAKKLDFEYVLAKSLIELRKKKNLTQAELAKKIGTKQPAISRIEVGIVKPTVSLLERIANALGTNLEIKFTPQ